MVNLLWRVPFLGGTPKLLARGVWSPVGWSPDARRMAFVRVDVPTSTSSLVVADASANAGSERVLATRSGGENFASLFVLGEQIRPVWSPDGRQIAVYEQSPTTGSRIVLVDAESDARWRAHASVRRGPRVVYADVARAEPA